MNKSPKEKKERETMNEMIERDGKRGKGREREATKESRKDANALSKLKLLKMSVSCRAF